MDTWKTFKEDIAESSIVKPGCRVLLAVSEGPDSVSLAHVFWRLSKTMPLTLFIAHLDHGLRRQSHADATFVQSLGKKLGLEVVVEKIDVKLHAERKSISLETAGRDERYKALAGIAKRLRCGIIATGHTATDNAETVLMWLLRGTGPDGLCGIPRERTLGKCTIVRPLLSVPRRSIIAYLHSQGLSFRVDRSNRSEVFTRNRIRHRLFPVLESINPRVVEHLTALSKLFVEDYDILRQWSAAAVRRCARITPIKIHLDLNMFFRYNKPTQMRILKTILPEKRTAAQIEQMMRFIFSTCDGNVKYSASWNVEKKGHKLRFTRSFNRCGDERNIIV